MYKSKIFLLLKKSSILLSFICLLTSYYSDAQKNTIPFDSLSKKIPKELANNTKLIEEDKNLLDTQNFNQKEIHSPQLQDWQPIFYINYAITVKNQFTGGLEFCLDCEEKSKLFLGLGYGLSSYDGKYFGLPDVYLSLNTEHLIFLKLGGSNRNLYSLAGVSLLNFVDFGFGYSYPLTQDKKPELKGFTFGMTIRITNNQKAYIPIRVGF